MREVQHERQAQGDSPRALSLTPAEAMDLAKEWFAEVGHSGGVHAFAYEAFMETFDLAMAMGMADPCLTVADKGSGETSGASIGELS